MRLLNSISLHVHCFDQSVRFFLLLCLVFVVIFVVAVPVVMWLFEFLSTVGQYLCLLISWCCYALCIDFDLGCYFGRS